MKIEHIETARLLLQMVTPEVHAHIHHTFSESDLMIFFGYETPEQYAKEKRRFVEGATGFDRSFFNFIMHEKNSGKAIGACGFHTWYLPHKRAEIGYEIRGESFKQQGYMKEALQAIIPFGFEQMNLHRIEAYVGPKNIPSLKLVRAFGFKEEGYLHEHYSKGDYFDDSIVFGLLRSAYTIS